MRNTAIIMRKLFFVNLYQTCSFVENRRNEHKNKEFKKKKDTTLDKTHTISFYYITNKYDKSKLETEEHVDDYFTCIYIQLYTSAQRTLQYGRQFH